MTSATAIWTTRLITWPRMIFFCHKPCSRKWQSMNLRATIMGRQWSAKTTTWRYLNRKAPTAGIAQPTVSFKDTVLCKIIRLTLFSSLLLHNAENSNTNAMHTAAYPYNFPDFSNNDMNMQSELKPPIHMDIPAGESRFDSDRTLEFSLCKFSVHYHSLRTVTFSFNFEVKSSGKGARKMRRDKNSLIQFERLLK